MSNSTEGRSENVWKALNIAFSNAPEVVTKVVYIGIEIQATELANAFNDYFLSFGDASTTSTELRYMSD